MNVRSRIGSAWQTVRRWLGRGRYFQPTPPHRPGYTSQTMTVWLPAKTPEHVTIDVVPIGETLPERKP